MQGTLVFLALMLSLCIFSSSCAELVTSLPGNWTNELGSKMYISVDNGGLITGSYTSKVSGSGHCAKGVVTGYQQDLSQPNFGFVVKWETGSVTVWSGQYFKVNDKEILKTMWLLRLYVKQLTDNWKATWTGSDTFWRIQEQSEISDCGSVCGEVSEGSGSASDVSGLDLD